MGIAAYIKEIGRGRDGARALTRAQAADLFGQLLDGQCSDLEVGAFCIAMRVKGETPEELAGFLDAIQTRLQAPSLAVPGGTVVVIPTYNGARRLPLLTPLLALLLAREGVAVLLHGRATENRKTDSLAVLSALRALPAAAVRLAPQSSSEFPAEQAAMRGGQVLYAATESLCPGLARLLDVRRTVGLRNSAHSLVKLLMPASLAAAGPALLVSSYTHPEYARSMAQTFLLLGTHAMLLRGTEGEAVADPRRVPQMEVFHQGTQCTVQAAQEGSLARLPDLPTDVDAASTAHYIAQVVAGNLPIPEPIGLQVEQILLALRSRRIQP